MSRHVVGQAVVRGVGLLPLFKGRDRAVRIRRGAGVSAYVGANGHFKSFTAAMDTAPTLAGIPWTCSNPDHFHTAEGRTSGLRTVLSTMRFTTAAGDDHPLWDPLDDYAKILRAEHADVVLDEVGGAAGATSGGDDVPLAVKAALQEMRRKDCLVRHTAPAWNRATKVLRECTQQVNVCLGFLPVGSGLDVPFDGPHDLDRLEMTASGLQLVNASCDKQGEHTHPSGRLWPSRRLGFVRTYDATTFDEWTSGKKERHKPMVRQLFWRPGLDVQEIYDTFAYVEKLGQVTDGGTCIDCGGARARRKCSCESPTLRRGRVRNTLPLLDDEPAA